MRASSFLAPLFFAATSLAQGVAEGIAPSSGPPDGCKETVEATFEIGTLDNPTLKHKRETAQVAADGALAISLKDGILHDQYNRTGSVVANRQFQFDGPPQAGAIYTGGFSVCANDSLAIGGSTRWWRCMSGDFGNLYDEWIGAQCHEIRIQAIFVGSSASSSSTSASTIAASDLADASSTAAASASTTSGKGKATTTSGESSFPTASAFTTSATGSVASGSSNAAVAPPADTSAAASSYLARGAAIGAVMAIIGAALIL